MLTTGLATAVYTVPAGYRALVRKVHVYNTNLAGNGTADLGINSGSALARFLRLNIPNASSVEADPEVCLNAGDSLYATNTTGLILTVSGSTFIDP